MSAFIGLTGFQLGHHGTSAPTNSQAGAQGEDGRGALAEMSEFYRQIGYEAGYSSAIRDHLEAFVATAETVLRKYPATLRGERSARQLLYSFISRLERQLDPREQEARDQEEFVEGGLGI